jgi:hypothetical protein
MQALIKRLFKSKDESLTPRLIPSSGIPAFHEWADRIVAKSGLAVNADSQKFVLANMLTQLKDGVRYVPDQFFIDRLHKYATNQIADRVREEIRDATKKKLSEASQPSAVTQTVENSNVLEIAKV